MNSSENPRPYISLIVPAYNEQDRIAASLASVESYLHSLGEPFEIIAVDDGSADDTHRVLQECAADSDFIRIVSYERNAGKGHAVRQGVSVARGEYIAFTDVDLSAPISEMDKLLAAANKGFDIAIGSRAVKDSIIPIHQPLHRELGGKGLNLLIRALAVPGIRDTQCGFKLFRGDAARDIFAKCFIDGWGFDIEVLYLARRLGYSIAEVGVQWSHAEGSKLRPLRAGMQVLRDIFRMRTHYYGV